MVLNFLLENVLCIGSDHTPQWLFGIRLMTFKKLMVTLELPLSLIIKRNFICSHKIDMNTNV